VPAVTPLAILESPSATNRVLVIEPDPVRGGALKALLDDDDQLSTDVVPSIAAAVRAIERDVPDLILTTALLPPHEGSDLIGRLKQMPHTRHVPVVDIPAGVPTSIDAPRPRSPYLLGVFSRRKTAPRQRGFDVAALRSQILEYIDEARASQTPVFGDSFPESGLAHPGSMALVPTKSGALVPTHDTRGGRERRRARRRRREEMPWLWTVKLPWGSDVRVVDMSSTGMLIETAADLNPGGYVNLKMIGEQENLVMSAYAVRSEPSWLDAGVVYRVALQFSHELATFGRYPLSLAAALRPRTLTDLVNRVMADVEGGTDPASVRAKFTDELRQLLPARDIRFGRGVSTDDQDAVHFTIPSAAGPATVLAVTFERGYQPSLAEFRFLQAAAAAAGMVQAFSPVGDEEH
jgi:hypothetical protein